MKALPLLLLATLPLFAAEPVPTFEGSIERLDPALDALLGTDAKIEVLATGFNWSEGPVWFKDSLVFSDVPENTAFQWKEGDKAASIFLKPSGSADGHGQGSNGLTTDAQGRLILCQQGDRCISRQETDGKITQLATHWDGKRFNSPNDVIISRDGVIYFTDPPYGMEKGTQPEIDFHGIYAVRPDGQVTALIKDLRFPNGIALSPDEKTLYIAASDPAHTAIYAFNPDGTNRREVFDATPLKTAGGKGLCDGMKVDTQGNIWTTGPGGVLILTKEGKHLGTILTGQNTGNCTFGDDGSTLYITADMFLLRVKTKVKGMGFK
jgi:gluconolactonase